VTTAGVNANIKKIKKLPFHLTINNSDLKPPNFLPPPYFLLFPYLLPHLIQWTLTQLPHQDLFVAHSLLKSVTDDTKTTSALFVVLPTILKPNVPKAAKTSRQLLFPLLNLNLLKSLLSMYTVIHLTLKVTYPSLPCLLPPHRQKSLSL
jgi:hypothetical protein